jgi:hypothetical protein
MTDNNFAEYLARREVDRLFEADADQCGKLCTWPIFGGSYVRGVDPIDGVKEMAFRALLAREHFACNCPPDVAPLPLSDGERDTLKGHGPLPYILSLFSASLDRRNYDLNEHPPFADYVSGVLWGAERPDGDIVTLPQLFRDEQLAELKKRFPPRRLPGLGVGFCWKPPKLRAEEIAKYRRNRARHARIKSREEAKPWRGWMS